MSDSFKMTLVHDRLRPTAHKAVDRTPIGYVIEIHPPPRTSDQNARFHAAVRAVAKQVKEWAGAKMDEDDWKVLFIAMLHKQHVVPSLDGKGFVVYTKKTRRMSVHEMAELTDAVYAWGIEHGVVFDDT